jgi:hypothetical protein
MLNTTRHLLKIKLEPQDLRLSLLALPEDKWEPVMLGQRRHFLKLAGVDHEVSHDDLVQENRRTRVRRAEGTGDIFFIGDLTLYVLMGTPESNLVYDEFGRPVRVGPGNTDTIEVGIIGEDKDRSASVIAEFEADLEVAIRSVLDGRKTRHMDFEWESVSLEAARLASTLASEGDTTNFQTAQLDDEAVSAALSLAERDVRDFAILTSEAVFLREEDAKGRKYKSGSSVENLVSKLRESGVVVAEYLLECSKRGVRLARFASPEDLAEPKVGSLKCATCGSSYSDEKLTEGYSLSALGRSLTQKSQWMTVWVTNLLVELGVPIENIVWNVTDSGEEVDLIVEFLGQIWIFELKDREFGAGDAHPFNYRRVKFGANQAIIITTDKVSKDAKRVFEDLSRDDPYRRSIQILFVEGLEKATETLRSLISGAAMRYARQRLYSMSELEGYDLDTVLKAKYGSQSA